MTLPVRKLNREKKENSLQAQQKGNNADKTPNLQSIQQGLKGLKPASERPERPKGWFCMLYYDLLSVSL
jgi:hypothetical protein